MIKENYKPKLIAKKEIYEGIEAWANKKSHITGWVFLEYSLIHRLEIILAL